MISVFFVVINIFTYGLLLFSVKRLEILAKVLEGNPFRRQPITMFQTAVLHSPPADPVDPVFTQTVFSLAMFFPRKALSPSVSSTNSLLLVLLLVLLLLGRLPFLLLPSAFPSFPPNILATSCPIRIQTICGPLAKPAVLIFRIPTRPRVSFLDN